MLIKTHSSLDPLRIESMVESREISIEDKSFELSSKYVTDQHYKVSFIASQLANRIKSKPLNETETITLQQ